MKTTLFCMHVMPHEIESLERFMIQYHRVLSYLDGNDDVTLKVTLNLNPELTDWDASEYKQGYFVSRFAVLFSGVKNINEIIRYSVYKKIKILLSCDSQDPLPI